METSNGSLFTEFELKMVLGGRICHFIVFVTLFLAFLIILTGNILIIFVICSDSHLHKPMYFFLVNLSVMELISMFLLMPNMLINFISSQTTISKYGCFIQAYWFFFFSTSDFLLLSVMSFDRYVAICLPLRYPIIMTYRTCVLLVVGCMSISFLALLYPTVMIPRQPFCGHVLDHFFCDNWAMLKLVCANTNLIKLSSIIASIFILIGSLMLTTISYICIIVTVIRIPSDTGRQKTFSTCVSHFTMVSLVFGSAIFLEIRTPKSHPAKKEKVFSLISTVMAPLLNPFIYTLRNKMVKDSIRKTMRIQ